MLSIFSSSASTKYINIRVVSNETIFFFYNQNGHKFAFVIDMCWCVRVYCALANSYAFHLLSTMLVFINKELCVWDIYSCCIQVKFSSFFFFNKKYDKLKYVNELSLTKFHLHSFSIIHETYESFSIHELL